MYKRLFIGENRINLNEVDSTNAFLKEIVNNSESEIEGLIVTAKSQTKGRGQQGTSWESTEGKNLTFSIFLKPNIFVQNQFLLSKVVSLGIADFLDDIGIVNTQIKWPNDIYVGSRKIAGILIENSLKGNKVSSSIVGIGLNVNQTKFNFGNSPTSMANIIGEEQNLDELLNRLLFFVEKRYVQLKQSREKLINTNYLSRLLGRDKLLEFCIDQKTVAGEIKGVNPLGKLQILIEGELKEFGLKEVSFL